MKWLSCFVLPPFAHVICVAESTNCNKDIRLWSHLCTWISFGIMFLVIPFCWICFVGSAFASIASSEPTSYEVTGIIFLLLPWALWVIIVLAAITNCVYVEVGNRTNRQNYRDQMIRLLSLGNTLKVRKSVEQYVQQEIAEDNSPERKTQLRRLKELMA